MRVGEVTYIYVRITKLNIYMYYINELPPHIHARIQFELDETNSHVFLPRLRA